MHITRRNLGRLALGSLATRLQAKPNSNFGGVQIGIIVSPVLFKDMPLAADELLKKFVELGVSAVEMQDVRIEAYAGAPTAGRPNAQQRKEIQAWRMSPAGTAAIDKYKTLHNLYRDAGVNIYAFRLGAVNKDTPEQELNYGFNAAQALGANQITMELPRDPEVSQRMGDFAAKRNLMIGYHNHTQVTATSWDTALAQSPHNGIQFDVGHYATAVNASPIPFMEAHHDRITCLHIKDRKFGANGGQNVPWGQGDTPLKEVLQVMKRRKYKFPAGIELEYPIPENSNTMAEIAKCLKFCKDALV